MWAEENVIAPSEGLAGALADLLHVEASAVQVLTSIVHSGLVVEGGETPWLVTSNRINLSSGSLYVARSGRRRAGQARPDVPICILDADVDGVIRERRDKPASRKE
jgi:hypothetical protein